MLTVAATRDYFAVNRCIGKKHYSFLCHVHATDAEDAMRIARAHGFTLPRGSFARRIGREGYFNALRLAFPPILET
jgi:hypothetical protein